MCLLVANPQAVRLVTSHHLTIEVMSISYRIFKEQRTTKARFPLLLVVEEGTGTLTALGSFLMLLVMGKGYTTAASRKSTPAEEILKFFLADCRNTFI